MSIAAVHIGFNERDFLMRITIIVGLAVVIMSGCSIVGFDPQPQQYRVIPSELRAQNNFEYEIQFEGHGVQTFVCVKDKIGYYWKYVGGQGVLIRKTGMVFQTIARFEGNKFKFPDGSYANGIKIEKFINGDNPSNDIKNIRMLAESSSNTGGQLDGVKYIYRIDSKGGLPTTNCESTKLNAQNKSSYDAFFVFVK